MFGLESIPYYLALGYLVVFILLSLASKYIRYSDRQLIIVLALFTISLSVIAFYWDPRETDLTRNFRYMDLARRSNESVWQYVFNSHVRELGYNGLITYNLFRYIIIRISTNNHLLPGVATFIDYSIFSYIHYDWNTGQGIYKIPSFLTLTTSLTFLPFLYVNSGIRNALAMSVMALGIYLYLQKNCKLVKFIIICFLAVTIHPVTIIAIPFAFMARLKWGWKGLVGIFAVSFSVQLLMRIFLNSSIEILRRLAEYYRFYTSADQYTAAAYYWWGDLLLIIFFIVVYLLAIKSRESGYGELIGYWELMYSFFVLGYVVNYDLFLRPLYIMGILAPTMTSYFDSNTFVERHRLIRNLLTVICILIGVYVSARSLRFYYLWQN